MSRKGWFQPRQLSFFLEKPETLRQNVWIGVRATPCKSGSHFHATDGKRRHYRNRAATLHWDCDLQEYWRKLIPGNDIDWSMTLLGGANSKTNTFRQACSQTTVQSTKIQQLCMNSDRAKDLFWFKPYGSHLRGNFWHRFRGPGFDVEIGTAQSFGRCETLPR